MTTKSVDLAHLRSVVLAGHAGVGQDDARREPPLSSRRDPPPRPGRRRDLHPRLRARGAEAARVAEPGRRHVRRRRHDRHDGRHARLSRLRRRDGLGGRCLRRRSCSWSTPSGGVGAGLETAVELGRATGTAACFFINKADRENADPTAALDALRATFGNKIAPLHLAIGAAESFSGYVDLVHRKAWQWDGKVEVEIPIPAELDGRGRPPARPAPRGRRRGRRRRPGEVPRRRRGDAIRSSKPASARASRNRSSRRSSSAAPSRGSACGPSSTPSSATCPRRPTSRRGTAREPKSGDVDPDRGRPGRAAPRPRLQDRRGSIRRPPDLPPGLLGHAPRPGHVWNSNRGEEERIGQLLLVHGKDQEPVGELQAGQIGAVAKLTVTATGDTLSARASIRSSSIPCASRPRRWRSRSSPRRRPTSTRWARPSVECSRRSRAPGSTAARPASSSSWRWAKPTSRSSASA